MFRSHSPYRGLLSGKTLLAALAVWGLSAAPFCPPATAGPGRPAANTAVGGSGGPAVAEADRVSGMQLAGDPDEYTQTGGSSPKPTPGNLTNPIYALILGYLRAWLLLVQGVLFR